MINKNTGQVFERRLIEKSIQVVPARALDRGHAQSLSRPSQALLCSWQDTGRDPLTNEPLNMDDLLEVKSNKVLHCTTLSPSSQLHRCHHLTKSSVGSQASPITGNQHPWDAQPVSE